MTPDADLCRIADEAAQKLGVVGGQVAVLTGNEVRQGCTGIANRATGMPVGVDTLFQIGSTSKVHAAALLMQQVAAGRVDLDAPVAQQLPDFRLPDPEAARNLTPRHLLSMSSGLDNGSYDDHGSGPEAMAHYIAQLAELPLVFQPGTGYGYSNASTNVTGRLTEHVLGRPWDDACQEQLLNPAGLTRTTGHLADLMTRSVANGHTEDGEPRATWVHNRGMAASGGTLCASAGDLVRFAHLFLHDGLSVDGERALPAGVATQMQERVTPVPPTLFADWWGLGPYGRTWDGVDVVGHSGTFVAGSSYLLWLPGRDLAVATTVNVPSRGYPFALACFRILLHDLARIAVPTGPQVPEHVDYDPSLLVGSYEMTGVRIDVVEQDGRLLAGWQGGYLDKQEVPPHPLVPLGPTSFLPTHPVFDGGRGWAIAFMGTEHGPASYIVNGSFPLRRTT